MTAAVEGALSRIMTKSGAGDDRNIVISHRHLKSQIQWISKIMTARGKQSERHACSVRLHVRRTQTTVSLLSGRHSQV